MKLAPTQNKLQPIPQHVQPAISQSVQRTATPADIQTIQNVQASQQSSGSQQQGALPVTAFVPSSANSAALWAAIVVAVLVAAGAIWFWKSF